MRIRILIAQVRATILGRRFDRRLRRSLRILEATRSAKPIPVAPPAKRLAADLDAALRLGLFDLAYYQREAGRRFADATKGFKHFNTIGWRARLRPSAWFDTDYYIDENPRLMEKGKSPLLQYLRSGRFRGRAAKVGKSALAPRVTAPQAEAWAALVRDGAASITGDGEDDENAVDVIVPVFSGYDDTLACLYAVLASRNITPRRLIVINDAGPDAELTRAIEDLAARGLVLYRRNAENQGFVRTANLGFAQSRLRDTVILNADTIVHADWLDRLRAQAYSAPQIGTVTPLSNNATLLSYPIADAPNRQDIDPGFAALDALAREHLSGRGCDIPTAVGFCVYVRRACLDAVGVFDADRFGRGYGEENDFSRRAIAAGWSNRAAFDVFVRHTGGVSFAAEAREGKARGLAALLAVHPDYKSALGLFAEADPVAEARRTLDLLRWRKFAPEGAVLMVDAGLGGGVAKHVAEMTRLWAADGIIVLRARPDFAFDRLKIEVAEAIDLPNLPALDLTDIGAAAQVLRQLGVRHVHVHSTAGYPLKWVDALAAAVGAAGLAYDMTLHDYLPVCPRVQMIDRSRTYCASGSEAQCDQCLAIVGARFGYAPITSWRATYKRFLGGARKVFAPSRDVANRVEQYLGPQPHIALRPHLGDGARQLVVPPAEHVIGLIGAISREKGADLLVMLAADAIERRLPLRFVVHGVIDSAALTGLTNVIVTGPYADDELHLRLIEQPVRVAFYPSLWPETFCYALDAALKNGLHPVSFDLGAIAERLKDLGVGERLPLDLAYKPSALNDRLLAISEGVQLAQAGPEAGRAYTDVEAYYMFERG